MTSQEPSNPVVRRLVAAINDGDRDAFLATLTPDATLTDDGNPRSLHHWIDREIFSAHGHMNVEHEQEDGLRLLARYRNDTWVMRSRADGSVAGSGLDVLTFGPEGRVRTDHQFVA